MSITFLISSLVYSDDCINTSVISNVNQFNFVQQCIQISTRINSISVHTYICVCFIRNISNIQHGVRKSLCDQCKVPLDSKEFHYLHGSFPCRNNILVAGKALRAPCAVPMQFHMLPSILPFILCGRRIQQVPVEFPMLQNTQDKYL